MAYYRLREIRTYYVMASSEDAAREVYGNAHCTEAVDAEVSDVDEIQKEDIPSDLYVLGEEEAWLGDEQA